MKHKKERVITQRDEEGELEAVYEIRGDKRLSDESRKGRGKLHQNDFKKEVFL